MAKSSSGEIRLEPAGQGIVYPFLRIYEEEGPFLKSFKISTRLVVIGRDKEADLRVQDKYISRKHFQIEFLGEGKLFLQDLGSANGTFLNGKKVERSKLEDGDEIVVGEKRVVISYKLKKIPKEVPVEESDAGITSPEFKTPFEYEATEAASEEELFLRSEEAVNEEVLKELEKPAKPKPKKVKKSPKSVVHKKISRASEPETVKVEQHRIPEVTKEEIRTDEESMAQVLEMASMRERRREQRSQELLYEPDQKIQLRKIVFFIAAGIIGLILLSLGFKLARNYFAASDHKKPVTVAQREENTNYEKENLVIPRPDIKIVPTVKKPSKEIVNETALRKDLSKSLDKARSIKKQQRTEKTERKSKEDKRLVSRKKTSASESRRKIPRPKATRVPAPTIPNVVDSLRKNDVLEVDLNKASGKLSASREMRGRKETAMSRQIDIKQIKRMLDIDVGLSIMSEEVMLSEKKDVNKFRNTLKKKISKVTYCYQDAVKKNPGLHGSIKVNFTVTSGGRVTRARVEDSSIRSRSLNTCIIKRVKSTQFDEPPHDNFMISYTFNFKKSTVDFTR